MNKSRLAYDRTSDLHLTWGGSSEIWETKGPVKNTIAKRKALIDIHVRRAA